MISEKTCVKCSLPQVLSEFRKGHRVCRTCNRKTEALRVDAKPGGKKAWNQHRYQRDREGCSRRAKAANLAVRLEVLSHYGGYCVCCGESHEKFLTLDHINQDGAAQRKATNTYGGCVFYYWVKRNGFPDDLRILCYNCNLATYRNGGICPHEETRLRLVA